MSRYPDPEDYPDEYDRVDHEAMYTDWLLEEGDRLRKLQREEAGQ